MITLDELKDRVSKFIEAYKLGLITQDLNFDYIELNKLIRSNNDWYFDIEMMPDVINDTSRLTEHFYGRFQICNWVYFNEKTQTLIYYGGKPAGAYASLNAIVNYSYNKLEYQFKLKFDELELKYVKEFKIPRINRHVDFYLPDYNLIIEVNSNFHDEDYDLFYQSKFTNLGYNYLEVREDQLDLITIEWLTDNMIKDTKLELSEAELTELNKANLDLYEYNNSYGVHGKYIKVLRGYKDNGITEVSFDDLMRDFNISNRSNMVRTIKVLSNRYEELNTILDKDYLFTKFGKGKVLKLIRD